MQKLMELRMISRVWNMTEMIVDEAIIRGEACGHQSCLINFEILSDQFHKPPRTFPLNQ